MLFLAMLLGVVIGTTIIRLWILSILYRVKKGRFVVQRDDARWYSVVTDFGQFTIDRSKAVLMVKTPESNREFPLEEVERLDYGMDNQWAWLAEIFGGGGIYMGRINWYKLSLHLSKGEEIPVFVAGQYEPREPLMGRLFELEARLLERFHLFQSVADHARHVVTETQAAFKKSGKELRLV